MTIPVTHLIVRDTPPPNQTQVIGRIYPINPEPVFKTYIPDYAPNIDDDDEYDDDEDTETKVVRGRRGRRPAKANEAAETK